MAKIVNMMGNSAEPIPGKQSIDITSSKPILCGECGYDTFLGAHKFRRISKILTGTPQDVLLPIEVFVCGSCGAIVQELMPEQIRELERMDKESNE